MKHSRRRPIKRREVSTEQTHTLTHFISDHLLWRGREIERISKEDNQFVFSVEIEGK
jgi:hypothetical protein